MKFGFLLQFLLLWQTDEPKKVTQKIYAFFDDKVGYAIFEHELFKIGEKSIQLIDLIVFSIFLLAFIVVSRLIRNFFVKNLLSRTNGRPETTELVGRIVQFIIIFLGFIITLQIVGVDLTSLNVIVGAIGVGIGIGLQNVASNFISGLIIIFERPFEVGDRIELGTIVGKITEIGGRSTKIRQDDETVNIVPNLKLITENVRSFRRPNERVPHEIKVFVGYGNDAPKVLEILQNIADKNEKIMNDPAPLARFKAFDANKLDFVLSVWVEKDLKEIEKFLSDLNVQIYEEFLKTGITPSAPLEISMTGK